MTLTLSQARAIVLGVFAAGDSAGLRPLSVVVLDAGGHVLTLDRADGSAAKRFEIAHGKAHGTIAMGPGSRALMARAEQQPYFIAAACASIGGALIPVPGGVLIEDLSGIVLGAVGVTGNISDNDEMVAVAAIEAIGLAAETG